MFTENLSNCWQAVTIHTQTVTSSKQALTSSKQEKSVDKFLLVSNFQKNQNKQFIRF